MNIEHLFMLGLGCACSVIGWFSNQLYRAVEKLREDMNALEIRIGTDFVRYDRLQDMLKPIATGIEEIKEVLKHKVDKP